MDDNNKTTINLKKQDLGDSKLQQDIRKLGDVKINVLDEELSYLSEVKCDKTGKFPEPFEVNGKNYQIVRAMNKKTKKPEMGVLSLDECDDEGNNIIYGVQYFEENFVGNFIDTSKIDKPISKMTLPIYENGEEDITNTPEWFNLADVDGYKHFFVDIDTGEISHMFKTTKEMMTSGAKLGDREDYMDRNGLKRFRLGTYFKIPNDGELQEDSEINPLTKTFISKLNTILAKTKSPEERTNLLKKIYDNMGVLMEKLNNISK